MEHRFATHNTINLFILFALALMPTFSSAGDSKFFDSQRAYELIKEGQADLVDVREKAELGEGIAKSARWLPTSEFRRRTQMYRDLIEDLDPNRPMFVYCHSGVRSARFVRHLEALGHDARNLGGYRDWIAAGLPTRTFSF